MERSGDKLKLVLGLKLRQIRLKRGLSLKDLAEATNVSISFLSEIEKGKKYPKPEKIMQLAKSLDIPFDDLVSLKVDKELGALASLLETPFLKEFPFELFDITPRGLIELMTTSPSKAGAFIRTFLEIGQAYDMRVEHFLLAALRSYQKMNENYFEDIESAAEAFSASQGWAGKPALAYEDLRAVFTGELGYLLEETDFSGFDALKGFRSIWVDGRPPKLIMNKNLLPIQKAFIIGRELGYHHLKLKQRAKTSSWIKVESFEQVLNNFKASYFAGALLINKDLLRADLEIMFRKKRWDKTLFLEIMRKYNATPEMILYRLSQLAPKFFGLREIYYIRFNHVAGTQSFRMTKDLNMSPVLVPHGISMHEHYCRRWLSIVLLRKLASGHRKSGKDELLIAAQRSRFVESGAEFFTITLARPLVLSGSTHASISFGFYMNQHFKSVVNFWRDPTIPKVDVNETCERCGLSASACSDRVAQPVLFGQEQQQLILENTLHDFLQEMEEEIV